MNDKSYQILNFLYFILICNAYRTRGLTPIKLCSHYPEEAHKSGRNMSVITV